MIFSANKLSFASTISDNKIDSIFKNTQQLHQISQLEFTASRVQAAAVTKHYGAQQSSKEYLVGSLAKPFITTMILKLEAQGKLSINQTLAQTVQQYGQWLPKKYFLRWKHIRIKQLLNMTSGIANYYNDINFNKNYTPIDLINIAFKKADICQAGTCWTYADTNYVILALLIKAISQKSFAVAMQQSILQIPGCDLTHTRFIKSSGSKYSYLFAARGLISNSKELRCWFQALFKGEILPPQQIKKMFQTVSLTTGQPLKDQRQSGFALGLDRDNWQQFGVEYSYAGSTPYSAALMSWLPKQKLLIVAIANKPLSKEQFYENVRKQLFEN